MSPTPPSTDKKKIEDYVHRIILSWLENRIDDVYELIDDNIEVSTSIDSRKYSGKSELREFFQTYLVNKKIIRYDEEDFSIHIDRLTAIAHYKFTLEYMQSKEKVIESGRDFFLFTKEKERWKLVWRSIYHF